MMEQYLVKKETVEWIMGIRRIVTERNKIKGGKRKWEIKVWILRWLGHVRGKTEERVAMRTLKWVDNEI